ncbi:MAG: hypothetical protein HYX87_07020 [Chloroflexi bacterium]|nr:hypothetical protein [Chloroflexota bacterium]
MLDCYVAVPVMLKEVLPDLRSGHILVWIAAVALKMFSFNTTRLSSNQ